MPCGSEKANQKLADEMRSRHSKQHLLLRLLLCLYFCTTIHTSGSSHSDSGRPSCFPADASALLQLKRSFIDPNLTSWRAGTDCCRWEGVGCNAGSPSTSRRVISLDLGDRDLQSRGLHPALFNLTSLRNLTLAGNDFMGASLPSAGFEHLTQMVHLDLSFTSFSGQIPIGMAQLRNLVMLDLSSIKFLSTSRLFLKEPSFQTSVANLSSLRELHLDAVDISSSGEAWSVALANSTPRLEILTLMGCGLSGSIHRSFSRLRSLAVISLTSNRIAGKVPEFFADFPLSTLDLSENDFEGEFPTKILQLENLKTLSVSNNPRLSGHLTSFAVENKLEKLDLMDTNFSDAMPESMVNLKSLTYLTLTTEGTSKQLSLIGRLPSLGELVLRGSSASSKPQFSWIGNLRHLTALLMYNYNFSEPIPSWIGNLTGLMILELDTCNLYGPIPPWIGNLTQLSAIDFSTNYLTGGIPRSIFALPGIETLFLFSNQLSGHLEDIENPSYSSLSNIDLGDNHIGGSIPQSYLQLTSLEALDLNSNKLTGTVELSSFWRLTNLNKLVLSNNMLSLVAEDSHFPFSSLPKITTLELVSCNLTELPGTLRFQEEISVLDLSNNHIHGVIPSWLWENWKGQMTYLNLSHNMFTSVGKFPSVIPMEKPYTLDLSYNRLEGNIPVIPIKKKVHEQISIPGGTNLDYSNNCFSSIPSNFGENLGDAIYLDLSKNKLNGSIPASVCSLSKLQTLDLSHNYFSGFIPSCLVHQNLEILKLRGNQFHGVAPDNIREECMLQTIDLNSNYISGKLPRSLSNCQDLMLLDIGNNQIVDLFPSWMGILPKLQVLVLRSNQFFGLITNLHENYQTTNYFSSLQILDLASNSFSGHLPQGWFNELKSMMANENDVGQVLEHDMNISQGFYRDTVTITFKGSDIIYTKILTTFKVMDLSNNSFDGPIPESVGKLSSLHGLNMSYNNFIEQIPSHLGNLTRLESLDLSWNHLSGEIPQELTSLTSLAWFNLSYNNLTGRIPQGNQFLSFPNNSFEGNPGLCGSQVSKQCDNPGSTTPRASDHPASNSLWQDRTDAILLFTFSGLGFGVGFALAIMFLHFCRIDGWNRKYFCICM